MHIISFIGGITVGSVTGVVVMCLLQINRVSERKKNYED